MAEEQRLRAVNAGRLRSATSGASGGAAVKVKVPFDQLADYAQRLPGITAQSLARDDRPSATAQGRKDPATVSCRPELLAGLGDPPRDQCPLRPARRLRAAAPGGITAQSLAAAPAKESKPSKAAKPEPKAKAKGKVAAKETLRQRYGFLFMMVYILLFLFVTIGIFNLIMAVFIDNVTDGCTKKRQRELGQNAPKNAWRIAATLRSIILQKVLRKEAEDEALKEAMLGPPGTARRVSKIFREKWEELRGMYGKPHSTYEYAELTDRIREDMAEYEVVVTRDEFNHWLASHEGLLDTLEDAEIDLSCKSDLFDVLDADMSGELEFEEMIDGLLKCRGPASKTDIIAIRLKARLLVRMLTAICSKLGIKDV